MAPAGTPIASAGSDPASLNPFAVAAMAEVGLDISEHYAKPIDSIDSATVATVITLCAEEVCPVFPGSVQRMHWPFDDPAAATGSEADKLVQFRRVREQIQTRLEQFFRSRK